MKRHLFRISVFALLMLKNPAVAHECGQIPPELGKSQSGYLEVPLDYSNPKTSPSIQLYWEKFPAAKSNSKGAIFFLPGGPLSHYVFHGSKSPYFIPGFLADYDFYMFDYRGFNCSNSIQSPAGLKGIAQFFDVETFANDFLSLKRELVGEKAKVIIYGGSFGGMLGGQILISHPEHIQKAILFSSDLDSEWFVGALYRLSHLVTVVLPQEYPDFPEDWKKFLSLVDDGKIALFKGAPTEILLTPDILSVYLWLYSSQSVQSQAALPSLIKMILAGNVSALEKFHEGYEILKLPAPVEKPPTLSSSILYYYRCNIFFPKGKRLELEKSPLLFGDFSTHGLTSYFNAACFDYDTLPEQPFDIASKVRPVDIPVLFWIGDRDMFDPVKATNTMKGFGAKVDARVMKGWSHDFGLNTVAGIELVRKMVHEFVQK